MILNKLKVAGTAILITGAILQTSISYADDSEVFFGSEQFMAKSKPNILFLLDLSPSMRTNITLADGSRQTRLDTMKDAVREVLYSTSLTGVNVGVMSFGKTVSSNTTAGNAAQLVYPVVDIDQVSNEGADTVSRATSGKDDAHQTTTGSTPNKAIVDSNVMVMGNLAGDKSGIMQTIQLTGNGDLFMLPRASITTNNDNTYSNALTYTCALVLNNTAENCPYSFLSTRSGSRTANSGNTVTTSNDEVKVVGFHPSGDYYSTSNSALMIFKNVGIPNGATINSATLTLTPYESTFDKANGRATSCGSTYERTRINWRVASARNFPEPVDDTVIYRNKLTTVSGFNFFPKQGSYSYTAAYKDNTNYISKAPSGQSCIWQKDFPIDIDVKNSIQKSLNIALTDTESEATYRANFKSIAAQSGAPMTDLAIRLWAGGNTDFMSGYAKSFYTTGGKAPKLTLKYTSGQTGSSMSAVRFNNIAIPRGATVTSAKVKFVPAGGSGNVTLRIRGEKANLGDAASFSAGENLANRSKTTAFVSWNINGDNWKTSNDPTRKYVETPDITNILQEIVNKNEWCGNQSAAFFLEHSSGNGVVSAFTYDENISYRPVLEYTYDKTTVPENACLLQNWEETLGSRSDDGHQTCTTANCSANIRSSGLRLANNNYVAAVRFPNMLLKNTAIANTGALANKGLSSAVLKFMVRSDYRGDTDARSNNNKITIVIDEAADSPRLKAARLNISNRWNGTYQKSCTLPAERVSAGTWVECDVSDLIRAKIQHPDWKATNSMTLLLRKPNSGQTLNIKSYEDGYSSAAKLIISAKDALMAPNSRTIRRLIVQEVDGLDTTGLTPTVPALYDAARYITNIRGSGPRGPYHSAPQWNGSEAPSPLQSSCQSTHLVLMSDGAANNNTSAYQRAIVSYSGNSYNGSATRCSFAGGADYIGDRSCGRSLARWLNTTNQSHFADDPRENIVTTHTVGFTLSSTSTAYHFLNELAQAGAGQFYSANNAEDLVDAFMAIVDSAKDVNTSYVSGQVSLSPQSKYDQRAEVYYLLLKPSSKNYWQGNMKRFVLKYITYKGMKRAVLYDVNNLAAVAEDSEGIYYISRRATSWWTSSSQAPDGGLVEKGGTLEQQENNPAERAMHVALENGTRVEFTKDNVGTTAQLIQPDNLGVAEDTAAESKKVTQGLVSFMRGYLYSSEGSFPTSDNYNDTEARPKKIGDAARSAVSFATYGCSDNTKTFISCPDNQLTQTLLVAGNDGFFRGHDMRTGKQLFAEIPQALLMNINELHEGTAISKTVDKLYGLDGTVKLYHDDTNNNGFIDAGETAYAIVVNGRGGQYIYAFDISSARRTAPKLKWTITPNKSGFSELGYTWSVPVVGKVNVAGNITNVLVFGGGYDPEQDNVESQTTDKMGRAIYMVNANTGALIDSITSVKSSRMQYSIPGTPAIITTNDGDKLITDIFVGDMGGQLWRIKVDNGQSIKKLMKVTNIGDNGVVASISGSNKENTRRIYETPAIFKFTKTGNESQISVNVGTGYRGHPLALYNKDRFYSFRFAKNVNGNGTKVLTENDLALADGNTVSDISAFKNNGFYIELTDKGEKMISGVLAEFNRLAFNTYVPNDGSLRTCKPGNGQQNSYFFDLLTGTSLFDTKYVTSNIAGLPSEPNIYCESRYCTISFGFESLTDRENDLINKDTIIDKCREGLNGAGNGETDCIVKTAWTDLFSPIAP